ncbi:MAG: DegT/DnrJ/EryC1/StrS aminotransferase family protein [Deltaproteobacteria bacterium]|nr:DegT/DnrJ/EryC1/StrS aminotransferase family protein [Deltaproteobacteria bacterium]
MKVEFFRHDLTQDDIERVSGVLRSTFLTTGPVTERFEKDFSRYTGLAHVVGLNSCTAALHLSLLALGIGPGDEVITTPMTFIATATAIMHAGAKPVFIDVEKDSGLMDVSKIEAAITARTKAIIPVHLYGSMVDMRGLRKIAKRFHLKVIEDAAHCIEGTRDGYRPGQLSDAVCYSFYATKNMTCGEGGAVATEDSDLAQAVRCLRLHGMSKDAATRYKGKYQHWDMARLGWKYNMHDISAALLIGQIPRLDKNLQHRQTICRLYDKELSKIESIQIPQSKGISARHLYTIWVDPEKRDRLLHGLHAKGIGVAVNYRAVHTLSFFRKAFSYKAHDFPNAYNIGRRTLSLPLYPQLSKSQINYVIESVKSILSEKRITH